MIKFRIKKKQGCLFRPFEIQLNEFNKWIVIPGCFYDSHKQAKEILDKNKSRWKKASSAESLSKSWLG